MGLLSKRASANVAMEIVRKGGQLSTTGSIDIDVDGRTITVRGAGTVSS